MNAHQQLYRLICSFPCAFLLSHLGIFLWLKDIQGEWLPNADLKIKLALNYHLSSFLTNVFSRVLMLSLAQKKEKNIYVYIWNTASKQESKNYINEQEVALNKVILIWLNVLNHLIYHFAELNLFKYLLWSFYLKREKYAMNSFNEIKLVCENRVTVKSNWSLINFGLTCKK